MDNRKDKRFEEIDSVLIKDKSQAAQPAAAEINAYTHDISLSGAWICCQREFPVGYVLRIVINLEGAEQPLEVDGEVVWARKDQNDRDFDIGVEFIHHVPDTILSLLGHFYGKDVAIPSSVS